jgi:hypothetical protein
MRNQKGQESIQDKVDSAVTADPSIQYFRDGAIRRTRYISTQATSGPRSSQSEDHADGELDRALEVLATGPLRAFGEWPIDKFTKGPPGVYSIWNDDEFLYVGIAYRDPSDTKNSQARGVWGRLSTHASGRRSGDQFNIYICDRFVVPDLNDQDRDDLRAGARLLDSRTREYIREHLAFRVQLTDTGATARRIEHHIRTPGLPHKGRPLLNPSGTEPD